MAQKLLIGNPTRDTTLGMPCLFLIEFLKEKKKEMISNFDIKINQLTKADSVVNAMIPKQGTAEGPEAVLRYLGRAFFASGVYGVDNFSTSQVDQWLDFVIQNNVKTASGPALDSTLKALEAGLKKGFFVTDQVTLADICIFFALTNNSAFKTQLNKTTTPQLAKFIQTFESFPALAKVQNATPAPKPDEPKAKENKNNNSNNNNNNNKQQPAAAAKPTEEGGAFSLKLKNATQGKVVTRFPPEPSGYMHIGHLKAALLNSFYAQKYEGELQIRFDDTNPAKEKDEYEDAILEDLKTLGITSSRPVTHTSDYFDLIQGYAEFLIKEGHAYVDDTPKETISAERKAKQENKNRNNSVDENMKMWGEMLKGSKKGQECVLRAKIDMKSKNTALRDPAIYRCLNMPHSRTKNKFKCYPLYDFACPIVDSKEGITHALRSNEYNQKNDLYNWVLNILKLTWVNIEDFSRVNFTYMLLGKRHLRWFVENNYAEGWDDPRFPTIRGFLRRGMTVEAMRQFILKSAGASKNVNLMEVERVWAINKQVIDPIVPRYTAVVKENIFTLQIAGAPSTPELLTRPRHPKNTELGEKVVSVGDTVYLEADDCALIEPNEEVTLMGWGNCIINSVDAASHSAKGTLNLQGDFRKTKKKLTFLYKSDQLVDLTLVEFDTLTTKAQPEEGDDITTIANIDSRFETPAFGDPALKTLSKGDIIQLERRGFWKIDVPFISSSRPMVLFNIPDGHTKKEQSVLSTKVHSKAFVDIGQSKKAVAKQESKKHAKKD